MLNQFKNIVAEEFNNFENKTVFLAISGGKDSMVLSFLLLHLNIPHHLLHCNFNLRGTASNLDEKFLLNYARENELKITTTQFNTNKYAEENKLTTQVAARELRYAWFAEQVKETKNTILLTAHHLDDSIETFFINLMRGTDLSGLAGIKNTSVIARPMLSFTTDQIKDIISAFTIRFREDESNASNKYLRNSLRNEIIPLIKSKTTGFEKKIGATMNRIKDIDDWHNTLANEFIEKQGLNQPLPVSLDIKELCANPDFIIEKIAKAFEITRSNSSEFIKFLSSHTGGIFNTDNFVFHKNREELLIEGKLDNSKSGNQIITKLPIELIINTNTILLSLLSKALPHYPNIQQLDFSKIKMPLQLKAWQFGDKIQPLGMKGTKLISDILINKKIANAQKKNVKVLVDNENNILCVLGIIISEDYKITAETKEILEIRNVQNNYFGE